MFAENLHEVFYELDCSGVATYVSPNVEAFTGYRPEELIGRRYTEFVHPEDRPDRTAHFEKILSGKTLVTEARYATKNGGYVWTRTRGCPVYKDGEPVGVVGVMIDVTEQKEAEEALRFQSLLLDQMQDCIFATDPEGRLTYANEAMLHMKQSSREELLGKAVGICGPGAAPDAAQRQIVEKTLAYGKWRGEVAGHRPDGTECIMDCRTRLVPDEQGRALRIAGIATDVTHHKRLAEALAESERKFREIFDNIGDAVFIHDMGRRFLEVNAIACRRLGYTRQELLQMSPADIDTGACSGSISEGLRKLAEKGQLVFETRHRRKDGETIGVEINSVKIEFNGAPSILSVARDITERRKAEAERERLTEKLRQAQKMEALGRMAGAVAHHFNNQLAAVLGHLELAMEDPHLGPAVRENLSEAVGAGRQATHICRQMLTYLGKSPGRREQLDLSALCREHLQKLKNTIAEGVRLEEALCSPGPVVYGSSDDLKETLTALVLNAWEAIEDFSGRVAVCTHLAEALEIGRSTVHPAGWAAEQDVYACLEVSDTGCGIRTEDLNRIFDPFFSTKLIGRGLGLAMATGVVKALGGAFEVESTVGEGSTFRVFLPLAGDAGQGLRPEKIAQKAPAGKRAVLVLEEDPDLSRLLQHILLHLGYTAVPAGSGREVLGILEGGTDRIACMIVGSAMQDAGAEEIAHAAKELHSRLPVLLVREGQAEGKTVMKEGIPVDAFVEKPYRISEIKGALDRVLR